MDERSRLNSNELGKYVEGNGERCMRIRREEGNDERFGIHDDEFSREKSLQFKTGSIRFPLSKAKTGIIKMRCALPIHIYIYVYSPI